MWSSAVPPLSPPEPNAPAPPARTQPPTSFDDHLQRAGRPDQAARTKAADRREPAAADPEQPAADPDPRRQPLVATEPGHALHSSGPAGHEEPPSPPPVDSLALAAPVGLAAMLQNGVLSPEPASVSAPTAEQSTAEQPTADVPRGRGRKTERSLPSAPRGPRPHLAASSPARPVPAAAEGPPDEAAAVAVGPSDAAPPSEHGLEPVAEAKASPQKAPAGRPAPRGPAAERIAADSGKSGNASPGESPAPPPVEAVPQIATEAAAAPLAATTAGGVGAAVEATGHRDVPRRPREPQSSAAAKQLSGEGEVAAPAPQGPPLAAAAASAANDPAGPPTGKEGKLRVSQPAATTDSPGPALETSAQAESGRGSAERPAANAAGSTPGSSAAGEASRHAEVDRVRFVQRVARAFHQIGETGGELRLRLSPPELGSLRLEVAVREGVLTARLETETPAARALLVENLSALRERLAAQEVRVERFDVDLLDRSRPDRQDHSGSGAAFEGRERGRESGPGRPKRVAAVQAVEASAGWRVGETDRLNVVI